MITLFSPPRYSSLTYPTSFFLRKTKKQQQLPAPPPPPKKKHTKTMVWFILVNYFWHGSCPGVRLIYPVWLHWISLSLQLSIANIFLGRAGLFRLCFVIQFSTRRNLGSLAGGQFWGRDRGSIGKSGNIFTAKDRAWQNDGAKMKEPGKGLDCQNHWQFWHQNKQQIIIHWFFWKLLSKS